jgi:hypothetical protein
MLKLELRAILDPEIDNKATLEGAVVASRMRENGTRLTRQF